MSDVSGERLVDTLLWFCRIPSPTGEERELAERLLERLDRASIAAPPRRHGDSIVVPVTRDTGGPRVVLAGHLDVVRTSHDGPPRVDGDKLYGPGASDMKAGLAIMLDLLEHGQRSIERTDLTLVFYAREEGPFVDNELGRVLEDDPDAKSFDLAICMEPSDNKLSLGATGSLHARLTFEGRTAHSGRPWQGENAIHKAGPLLTELAARPPRESIIDGLVYRTVTSVTLAEGGRGRNVVPDAFTLNVNHRFAPEFKVPDAQRHIEELVAGRAQIEWMDLAPSAPPHASHPLVVALRDAGARGVEAKQAWTDVARFAELGVPAVNWGPGVNTQAHQRNEWTHIPLLIEGREILGRFFEAIGRR